MYQPPAFREDRIEVLHALIRSHPLGTLITAAEGLCANLIPFTLVEDGPNGLLRAHVAAGNDQLAALRASAETLVIFQSLENYITPSWYATKREHGKVVPTWNYVVVQAWGHARVNDDPAWLRAQIEALTATHEQRRTAPWAVTDAPRPFIDAQLKGIVGIEIPIERLEGKWKASQNRNDADRAGVAAGLTADGSEAMAALVAGQREA
jgi:transcriptional regulator